jgi:hypothetical protein
VSNVTTSPSSTARAQLAGPTVGLGLAGLCGLAILTAGAAPAAAQPKTARPARPPARACGVTAIPLVVGNEWVYEPVAVPADRDLSDAQKKLTPVRPDKIAIKVTAIDTKDGVTTVSLREDIDGKAHDTTITCTAGGGRFQIGMASFWFAGEPGTVYGIELGAVERKGQTLTLAGGKLSGAVSDWRDDIKASWKHVPTAKATPAMRGGQLELGRHWVALPDEPVATKVGQWNRTRKLGLETAARVGLEPPPEKPLRGDIRCKDNKHAICQCKMPQTPQDPPDPICTPPLLVNFFWFVDGIGPVQVLNSYGQMFQLSSTTLQ